MSIRARLDRLDRHRRPQAADDSDAALLDERMRAGEARVRQAAADAGTLEEYEARRQRVRDTIARNSEVLEARRRGDTGAEVIAILRCGRQAAREQVAP